MANSNPDRRKKSLRERGYAVIAIPESGLFLKDGKLMSGHGTEVVVDEIWVFTRSEDATANAKIREQKWQDGDGNGRHWNFPVLPVFVSER